MILAVHWLIQNFDIWDMHVLELLPLISDNKDGAATAAAADNLHGDGG